MTGRATATILFTDLVGSTELRSQLGEEAADELRRRHDEALSKAVADHGGRVVKGLGDGIMATFTGASDAVAAAVAIQQAVDRLNRSGKAAVALAVRIGLSAGDVAFEDDDVHGTPVIEASRLCGAAAGGEVLAADLVRALAGSATTTGFAGVGPLELKGLAQPVPAVRVEWEPAATLATPMPALLTNVGRIFVGRDAESERLGQLWKEAAAGERRVALLAGEPGVGKTRLAAELASGVHEQGALVLAGRCDEDLGVPFQPFVEAMHHYVAHVSEPRLGRYGGELARLVPELAATVPGLPEPLRSDPETERYRLFDAIGAWLADVSAEDPVLLVLDDVHWAAKPTLLLLRHVLRSAAPLRLLVVVTYRDSEVGRGHPLTELLADLRRVEGVERFRLTGLDEAGVAAFIEAAAGRALAEEDEGLPRAVWAETEGNPFFVAEVLRHLSETGGVEYREGRWVRTVPVEDLGIPEGVRDVVGRRLSRLTETANRALRVAAFVGLEFEPAVMRSSADLGDDELYCSLEEAVNARLLTEVPGSDRYRFSHALVRATLYDEVTAARRAGIHQKIAEAIETVHARALDNYLPALAHHWARASVPTAQAARAIDYAARAGDRALAQLAHDEAAAYYRQAIELLDATEGQSQDAQRLELLIALGEAQRRAGDPAHRDTLLGAVDLARRRGDAAALARAALANCRPAYLSSSGVVDRERVAALEAALEAVGDVVTPVRARLLAALGVELVFTGQYERRVALSNEALTLARRLDDPASLAHVLLPRFLTIYRPSTLQQRLADTAELLTLAGELNDPLVTFFASWHRARVTLEAGDVVASRSHLEAAEALTADLGQKVCQWMASSLRLGHVLLAGHVEEADRLAAETLELGEATGQPDAGVWFAGQQLLVRFEQGRLEEIEPLIADLVGRISQGVPGVITTLGLVYSEAGRLEEARALFEPLAARAFELPEDHVWLMEIMLAAEVVGRLDDRSSAAALYQRLSPYPGMFSITAGVSTGCTDHYLGMLAAVLGRHEESEQHFRAAAAVHQKIVAPAHLGRTYVEWARLLLARRQPGDADRAGQLLDQALSTARELRLVNVERRAVAALGALS